MNNQPMNYDEIKIEAQKILIQNSIVHLKKFPVPIAKLANSMGYKVKEFSPDKNQELISGMISNKSDRILINADEPYERQRFTIAHEIGHLVLHFPKDATEEIFVDFRKPRAEFKDARELQADEFAGCLLMPEEYFKEAWQLTEGDFKKMSIIFGVSKSAVGMRAFNLRIE